jgi:hypothetical protein
VSKIDRRRLGNNRKRCRAGINAADHRGFWESIIFQTMCKFLESRGDWWKSADSTSEITIMLQRAKIVEAVRFFEIA